jgi:hypothetical protein
VSHQHRACITFLACLPPPSLSMNFSIWDKYFHFRAGRTFHWGVVTISRTQDPFPCLLHRSLASWFSCKGLFLTPSLAPELWPQAQWQLPFGALGFSRAAIPFPPLLNPEGERIPRFPH